MDITENEYLEMANQLKIKFEENDKLVSEYVSKYNELYKTMTVVYGLLRTYIDNTNHSEYDTFLGEMRTYLSETLFKHLKDNDYDE